MTISPITPPTRAVQQFEDLGFLQDFAEWGRRKAQRQGTAKRKRYKHPPRR